MQPNRCPDQRDTINEYNFDGQTILEQRTKQSLLRMRARVG